MGKRTGKPRGRPKGVPNKATAAKAAAIAASGLTPLDFMLQIMRDETKPDGLRANMARDAAPYVHPRLAAVEHTGKGGGPVELVLKGSDIDG